MPRLLGLLITPVVILNIRHKRHETILDCLGVFKRVYIQKAYPYISE